MKVLIGKVIHGSSLSLDEFAISVALPRLANNAATATATKSHTKVPYDKPQESKSICVE